MADTFFYMNPNVKLTKDQHIWAFNADMKPVVSVQPGTVIEIETWDCFTGQVQKESDTLLTLDMTRVNSATGPIEVIGAEPGDSLSVSLIDIKPGPQGASMVSPSGASSSSTPPRHKHVSSKLKMARSPWNQMA